MSYKLDRIRHFKNNSCPEAVYSPGIYPHPELLEVLQDIHTRTGNFWKFCTPAPQKPGVRVQRFCNERIRAILDTRTQVSNPLSLVSHRF